MMRDPSRLRRRASRALFALVRKRGRGPAVALLNRYGATQLTQVPERKLWFLIFRAHWLRLTTWRTRND